LEEAPWRSQGFPEGFSGGIAHRLDVSTSGLLLVAEDADSLAAVRSSFAEVRLEKTYRFLTSRTPRWTEHHVTTPIAHHKTKRRAMIVQRGKDTPHRGKWYAADTRFVQLDGPLWEATITTGVMHQIRVHAASVGLALWGDHLYGGGQLPEGSAPPGVTFVLHHASTSGPVEGYPALGAPPLPVPRWWESLAERA
jgi:23S rRNA-/tRNA-specific pseudouridylate synthase